MSNSILPAVTRDTWLGHPKGLFLLFATEMWERFSYYGMRALLVLSLIAGVEVANPGFGWSQSEALKLYGLFTGFVYFTPLIGGWLADNYLGQRKSVIIGGLLMAIGQFTLASAIPGNLSLFYVGLVILVLGNGFFKPNISTMVGDLYEEGDARRDGAFTIFYMGINAGAFIAPLVCSTLGEDPTYGWRAGYFAAGVGMVLSVIIQLLFARRYLDTIGIEPAAKRSLAQSGGKHAPLTPDEVDRLRVIFMLFIFVVLFWAAFEQAGGLMNIYANDKTDRMVGSFEVPAGWFQSLNPLFIVLLAPIFSAAWSKLGAVGRNPATPRKMVLGLVLTGIGFLAMVAAALRVGRRRKGSDVVAGDRVLLPHHRRTVHFPGRPLDGDQARAAQARLPDDGRLVPDQLRRQLARRDHRFLRREPRRDHHLRRPRRDTVRFRRRAVDAVRDARALDARRRDHPARLMPSSPPRNHAAAPFPRSTPRSQ